MKRNITDRTIDATTATLNGMNPELASNLYGVPYEKKELTDKQKKAVSFYDALSEEDKRDTIEINGHKYIRKIYERKGE